jgi:hypothetical protein
VFTIADVYAGAELNIYNRIYTVIDCDQATRKYLDSLNRPFGDKLPLSASYWDPAKRPGNLRPQKKHSKGIKNLGFYEHERKVLALRLGTFRVPRCDVWFMRFAVCAPRRIVAVGNVRGEIDVIDLSGTRKRRHRIALRASSATVRGIAFNAHGDRMVVVCDDGSLHRLDADDAPKNK